MQPRPAPSNPLRTCVCSCHVDASSGDGSVDPEACHSCDGCCDPRPGLAVRWVRSLVAFLLLAFRVVSLWFLLQPLLVLVFGVLTCGYAALIKLLVPRTLTHTTVLLLLAAALIHSQHTPASPVPHPSLATCPGSFKPRTDSRDVAVNTTFNYTDPGGSGHTNPCTV
jgi:hypothetical protein